MTPKPRKQSNKSLPERWSYQHGAYYYRPRDGEKPQFDNKSWFRLGSTLHEAHREFAERIELSIDLKNMSDICDRYAIEVLPLKSAATQKSQIKSMARIRAVFGENKIQSIESFHIYQYRDAVAKKKSQKIANLDLELLSHIFTKAIEWGARKGHPMTNKQVTKFSLKPRDRYVTDNELNSALQFASTFIRQYVTLKLLLGVRKGEILKIKLSDITDEGIFISRTKGGRDSIYEWTPALRAAINAIRSEQKKINGMYLFSTREGRPYIDENGETRGFNSVWQRFMKKVVDSGIERFTEHDLRAKVASDTMDLDRAQELLGHTNSRTTNKTYMRKPSVIRPAK